MTLNGRNNRVDLVIPTRLGPGARHGLSKVRHALQSRSIRIRETPDLETTDAPMLLVLSVGPTNPVATLLTGAGETLPEGAESLRIHHTRWNDKQALLAVGSDDRGLMYALLDIADRVGWSRDAMNPFDKVRDTMERPAVSERAVSKYSMHYATLMSYFHDEAYWARYLDMLAQCRFNTFALLFAYESGGLFAPAYPYFFEVDGFPQVQVVGLSVDAQAKNLRSLNRLVEMTHQRGLSFTLGLWDHIYRGGVQRGPENEEEGPLRWRVSGVTDANLVAYNQAGLTRLLQLVPNLDAIQFRMHGESGLKRDEMEGFWSRIYDIMVEHGKGIRFDARAKEFPDRLIDIALEKQVPIRICTKYWMEQMGMPFHPTHIHPNNQHDRRHGYADLCRYPQRYKIHWRLWNGGTARILLWGDPEYARRFAESTRLYDGDGFEVNEPLATKMAGHDHDMAPFDLINPRYRHYDWEFERYWHFFQCFGRVGYNPHTPPEVWEHEFESRFGQQPGQHLMLALQLASGILPRVVAYNYPYGLFPTTRGWIEKQRMEDLSRYAEALPSDTEQFLSFEQAVLNELAGQPTAKRHPLDTSTWFADVAEKVLDKVAAAEGSYQGTPSNEFITTVADLRILACLARYHSRRIHAGLDYMRFKHTRKSLALENAIAHEKHAIEAWRALVEAAGDVYADDIRMGRPSAGLSGHWCDELAALEKGLAALEQQLHNLQPPNPSEDSGEEQNTTPSHRDRALPDIQHEPVLSAKPGEPLPVTAVVRAPSGVQWVRLRYRHLTQFEDYEMVSMEPTGQPDTYSVAISGNFVVPEWDLIYFIEAVDRAGNGRIYPDLDERAPYVVVKLIR